MSVPGERLDRVLAALADPTRREIIERLLARGEASVGDVAEPFRISAPAISRHLRVLEHAGLIERRVEKQRRMLRLKRGALRPMESWMSHAHRHWSEALDRLEATIAASKRRKS